MVRAARQIGLPADQQIIHAIPQEYIIDDQGGIREPVGLSGVRLEAVVHIVTGSVTSVANIIKCVRRAGYEVADLVLEPIASSHSVLSPDEKELGVVLLDIGGGTTDFTLFFQGAVRHSGVVAVGGDFVTRDLAYGLRTSHHNAEALKRSAGSCLIDEIDPEEQVAVPRLGATPEPDTPAPGAAAGAAAADGGVETAVESQRMVRRQVLAEIIAPRMEEIFVLVDQQLRRSEYYELASGGMVLTGGASQLHGTARLAELLFQMPVRRGVPQGVSGLTEGLIDPANATGIGLLQYGHEHRSRHFEDEPQGGGFLTALRQWTRRILQKF